MTIHANTFILIGVFLYFAIGALYAGAAATLSVGFSGKVDPRSFILFFAWPVMLLMRVGWPLFFLAGIAAAALITWVISWVLP